MLDDKSLNGWLSTLGKTGKAARDASLREDWPSDENSDIKELIDDISFALDEIMQSNEIEVIKSLDNSTLLGLSALFSFPRTLRLINILGNADPDKLSSLTNRSLAIDEQSRQFIEMLYVRISYTARTCLMIKIFSKERVRVILAKLSENIAKQSNKLSATEKGQTETGQTETGQAESNLTGSESKQAATRPGELHDNGLDMTDLDITKEDINDEN